MNQFFYPAIFHTDEQSGFWISFPDFPECMTQGEDMHEAYEMAVEALGLCIEECFQNGETLPEPSLPNQLAIAPTDCICIIDFDLIKYRRKHNSKAIKKTLSIPEWLNEIAIEQNINFSQVLQEALMQKVGIL